MRTRAALLVLAALLFAGWRAEAATRYDPRLRFRTISTARFDIHFHQGLEAQARRLAVDAETMARRVDEWLGPPSGRVHVILVHQSDFSNGWATPLPHNVIELAAAAPASRTFIGNTDDWLRLVLTHEYTHIVHLERGRGVFGGLRRVFGRLPLLYPNLFTPLWQIEGLATFAESRFAGGGRIQAGDFRTIVDRAARADTFLPIDRAGGGLIDWPAGHTPYAYGGLFHQHLAGRFGEGSLRELTDSTAGRIPYIGAPAFRSVFDRTLGDLWREFEAERRAASAEADVSSLVRRVTSHGFEVTGPRQGPDGGIYYGTIDPHGFPALMSVSPRSREPQRMANRYFGATVGFARREIVFDQAEVVHHVGVQFDLYAVDLDSGGVRQLTRGARASEPDVSPDGDTIVCTILRDEGRALAVMPLPARGATGLPQPLVSADGSDWFSPRWSPDGRTIAAERRRLGGPFEIVLVDVTSGVVRPLLSSRSDRYVTPAWGPDGRNLLFATAAPGQSFRIESIDIVTGRRQRLAGTGPNAHSPSVSSDGRTLVFVGYTADGQDVFALDLAAAEWAPVDEAVDLAPSSAPLASPTSGGETASAYAPWPALVPRFWTPSAETDAGELVVGAATGSADPLGRHAYAVQAGWNTARARPDLQAIYTYDRWWPTAFVDVSDDTDPFREGEVRSREVNVGVVLPRRRVRVTQSVLAALHGSTETFSCDACAEPEDVRISRGALRGGWRLDAARAYGYSIGEEEGWSGGATIELIRRALGSDADASAATGDVRAYLRLGGRHRVLAVRAAGAASWGDARARRQFSAAGGDPRGRGFAFGSDAIGLIRGLDEGEVFGERAVVVNVDYRVPLARVERGIGTLPVFARTVHAAVFVDAGHAWTERFRARDGARAVGAELSLDTVIGYGLPLTLTAGVSWTRIGARSDAVTLFARVGRAF